MIRFYCNSCGKSLRADETIVGRNSKCTACGEVNRVPPESSRKPGEKKRPDDDLIAVLANSDSFDDLNDMDFSASDLAERHSAKSLLIEAAPQINSPSISKVDRVLPKYQPRLAKRHRTISPALVASLSGLLVFLGLAYWIFLPSGNGNPGAAPKTAFEQTIDAQLYAEGLIELRKSHLQLGVLKDGLIERGLPDSHLSNVVGITQKFESLVNDGYAIKEGNSLFDQGNAQEAQKLIKGETKRLRELKNEIDEETKRLTEIVYSRN